MMLVIRRSPTSITARCVLLELSINYLSNLFLLKPVIDSMSAKNKHRSAMSWVEMNMLQMTLPDESFDAAIDKV
jgi:hypothetical protein